MASPPSSIDSMTIAQVRRALAHLRRTWDEHAPDNPIFPSDSLPNHMSIERFAFRFVLSHHERRHQKSCSRRRGRGGGGEEEVAPSSCDGGVFE